jgi:hypothetical protein
MESGRREPLSGYDWKNNGYLGRFLLSPLTRALFFRLGKRDEVLAVITRKRR